MDNKKILTKEERIKKEVRRLKSLYKDLGKDKQKLVKALIDNAGFMIVTLLDLQEHINIHGTTSEYQNGENQWGTKKSPEVEIHIAMTKNLNQTMRQLTDLLPDTMAANPGEELLRFVAGVKK